MARNGSRRPPRPRIEFVSGGASGDEAAAIVAGLERFLADTSRAPRSPESGSPWQRAALVEGVRAKEWLLPRDPRSG